MNYEELVCHDCGKHLGWIIDCGPRGMSFCDECHEKEVSS
jgi:peptide methionine sulfoxide reductase MsrB